jgi:hypothetical protein
LLIGIGYVGLINIILGAGLVLAGRKLFWFFVAAAGFVLGAQLTIRTFHGPDWLGLIIGIVVGVLFALLAVFLRAIAIAVIGFLSGGAILLGLVQLLNINVGGFSWAVYIIGGLIGMLLLAKLFDWALITLSSLAGAGLIVQELTATGLLGQPLISVLYAVIVIIGIVFQGAQLRRERARA